VKRFPRLLLIAMLMGPAWQGAWSAEALRVDDLLDALVSSYPEALARHDSAHVYWLDGTVMDVTDGRDDKPFDDLLANASILDQFRLRYPRGRLAAPPALNADPGRFRNEAFFRKMYGNCQKGEVQRNMAPITWLPRTSIQGTWGKTVQVTKVNGVASTLKQVSAEIDALPTAIKAAAYPIAGVFSCRAVKDTGRPSMHAYAAAIDLNIKTSDYWLWQMAKGGGNIPYRNRMPQEIVDIFERHGFIWGGKWYHYDTMHFEYRPELLKASGAAQPEATARPEP
jgi:hypothetical protein